MRWLVGGLLVVALAIGAWAAMRPQSETRRHEANPVAAEFVARYVDADGRIADTGNGGISHSEGQGYGLLLAESADDRKAFDNILAWTERHLAVRKDGLLSWRWDPAQRAVTDPNNASDGEVLIAWALLRAYDRWGHRGHRARALELLEAVESALLRPSPYGPILLPGADGFAHDDAVVVNLSYWIFPAFDRFAQEGRSVWNEVSSSGYQLAEEAALGAYGLPTDWTAIRTNGETLPAEGWAPEFGYNAVRIPLHMCWTQLGRRTPPDQRGRLDPFIEFWNDVPAASSDRWSVETDRPAGGGAPPAYGAIAALTAACGGSPENLPLPALESDEAYFSAALKGLVSIAILDAWTEARK